MNDAAPVKNLPDFDDVIDAARRLSGQAVTTPLLDSDTLDRRAGRRVLVKAECLQRTGSFKFRGAYNKISRIAPAARAAGVAAWSSGNHAQGVAAAAHACDLPAKIVMPDDAPALKIARTRRYGAEVVLYDRWGEDREAIARKLAAEEGRTIVPPYDDPLVMAGQGTVGNELADQCLARGESPKAVLIPCSGGGLAAGCALALRRKLPSADLYVVEPAGFDDTARSLAAGRRIAVDPGGRSICDALLVREPGALTFAVNQGALAGGLTVTDDAVLTAMAAAFQDLKLVLEPGGAAALAAVLSGALPAHYDTVAVIASGGNVDPALFARAVAADAGDGARDVDTG